jgi:hypothetical protein
MGVFTVCDLLASLGWEGVNSVLVITSKVWSPEKPVSSMDVSTSMSELKPEGSDAGPKPAALSFRDKRARLEWPKKRMYPRRKSRGTPRRSGEKGEAKEGGAWKEQASWEECSQHEWSGPAGLPKNVEEV